MASTKYSDHQKYKSEDGTPLTSLGSHPCMDDSKERYVLWSDIQHTFQGIHYLETEEKEMILFAINTDGELCQPLRIQYQPFIEHIVIYSDNQRQQTSEESSNIPQRSDDHGQGDSQSLAHGEIQPSLKDVFETCRYLYQHARIATNEWGGNVRQVLANARYYHLMLVEELKRLDKGGANSVVDGKSQERTLEELRDLEQQVRDWEYQETCYSTLEEKSGYKSYATSSIFLVLPSDLDSWEDSNTSKHQFRFYYMCDNKKQWDVWKDMKQHHVHLANHPGYLLKRQQEFFHTYGDYVLRMLLMTKSGHSNESYEIPPLDTLKILWGCDHDVIGSHINKDNIGLLIDKAINYLQELSPPKWMTKLGLNCDQSAAIRTFLDVQDDHNAEGNLYRYNDPEQYVFWMCKAHALQHSDDKLLEELREFVQSHGGRVDMQQARLEVELGSSTEAEQFRTLLKGCGHSFDISLKLTWNAMPLCVKELCADIAGTGPVALELDGITLDIDSQGYDRSLHMLFKNLYSHTTDNLPFITLLNYPRRHEQSILLARFLLQSVKWPARSPHSWIDLQDDLDKFRSLVSAAQDPSDWNRVATVLLSTLETHGVSGTNMVIMYSDGWSAVFDPNSGAVVKIHSPNTICPERILSTGTITSLGVHVDSLRFDKGFFRAVRTNALLQELHVSYLGHNVLYYAGHISRMWHASASLCRFTLFDCVEGTHDRVVAQLAIGGSHSQSSRNSVLNVEGCAIDTPISQQQALDAPMDFVLEQWDCDYIFSQLSNYSASFLDMATKQHPLALTVFTLDVSQLSRVGLSSIQEVFGRSNLEQLHVVCTPVDSLSQSIAQVLGCVQWSTLKSLILSGDKIDEWCLLWPSPGFPQLLSLQIQGSSSAVQDLSHSSVLFLQQLIFSSPLVELYFSNIQLQDKRNWALLVDSMDLSRLQTLDLSERSAMQFLIVPDAVDLFVSGLESTHLKAEGLKLILSSFTLDTTTMSQPDLAHVRVILNHCCLKKLVVKCNLIDLNISDPVTKVLDSVHWVCLEHLMLTGDDINRWIQPLIRVEAPRLKTLRIFGTKSVQQELSHESVLFIERLIGKSPLSVLYFEDVLLQDQRDWARLVDKMDPSTLEVFNLGERCYQQFMSTETPWNSYIQRGHSWRKLQRTTRRKAI